MSVRPPSVVSLLTRAHSQSSEGARTPSPSPSRKRVNSKQLDYTTSGNQTNSVLRGGTPLKSSSSRRSTKRGFYRQGQRIATDSHEVTQYSSVGATNFANVTELNDLLSRDQSDQRLIYEILNVAQKEVRHRTPHETMFLGRVLEKYSLFEQIQNRLGMDAYCLIASQVRAVHYHSGETIQERAQSFPGIYMLLIGSCATRQQDNTLVMLRRTTQSQAAPCEIDDTVRQLCPGDGFGLLEVLQQNVSQMLVTAGEGGAHLLFVSRIDVLGALHTREERSSNQMAQFERDLRQNWFLSEKFEFFQQLPILSKCKRPILAQLAYLAERQQLTKGQLLYRQGDLPTHVYFIHTGQIKLVNSEHLKSEKEKLEEVALFSGKFVPVVPQDVSVCILDENQICGSEEVLKDQQHRLHSAICTSSKFYGYRLSVSHYLRLFQHIFRHEDFESLSNLQNLKQEYRSQLLKKSQEITHLALNQIAEDMPIFSDVYEIRASRSIRAGKQGRAMSLGNSSQQALLPGAFTLKSTSRNDFYPSRKTEVSIDQSAQDPSQTSLFLSTILSPEESPEQKRYNSPTSASVKSSQFTTTPEQLRESLVKERKQNLNKIVNYLSEVCSKNKEDSNSIFILPKLQQIKKYHLNKQDLVRNSRYTEESPIKREGIPSIVLTHSTNGSYSPMARRRMDNTQTSQSEVQRDEVDLQLRGEGPQGAYDFGSPDDDLHKGRLKQLRKKIYNEFQLQRRSEDGKNVVNKAPLNRGNYVFEKKVLRMYVEKQKASTVLPQQPKRDILEYLRFKQQQERVYEIKKKRVNGQLFQMRKSPNALHHLNVHNSGQEQKAVQMILSEKVTLGR